VIALWELFLPASLEFVVVCVCSYLFLFVPILQSGRSYFRIDMGLPYAASLLPIGLASLSLGLFPIFGAYLFVKILLFVMQGLLSDDLGE
jgi:hypothetical protein